MFGIYEFFETSCAVYPEKTAVLHKNERLTYRQLKIQVDALAAGLYAAGVKKGEHVSLLLYNGIPFIRLFFALLKLGATISPLNYRDTVADLKRHAQLVDSTYLIFEDRSAELVSQAGFANDASGLTLISETRSIPQKTFSLEELMEGEMTPPPKTEISPLDVVLNIFTGGTTGEPKAASHTYQGLTLQLMSCYMTNGSLCAEDVFLNYAPMFHVGGITAMLQTLCVGATFIINEVFEASELLEWIEREGVTQMSLIPPTLCFEFNKCANFKREKLSSVRMLRMSGGNSSAENINEVFRCFPRARVFNGYGMSERAVNMVNIIERDDKINIKDNNVSVGRLSALNECKIVDEQGGTISEPWVLGELYGRGPCMMKGYYAKEKSFESGGWFATGDMFFTDEDGNYYFADRKKNMIKSGGENIYSLEVEKILNCHPSVRESAVVGIPDERLGESVAAAVALWPGAEPVGAEELIALCKKSAASYKKPRKIIFVDDLPRNSVGKTRKSEVKRLFEEI